MDVVIYARFSSSSQREASIEEQEQACREYADRYKYIVTNVYSDSAMTGRNDNRPALRKLLKDSAKHLFEGVLVYSIDRFGRDLEQSLSNEKKLKENGVVLISATEPFVDNSFGRYMRILTMLNAQQYSENLSEKIHRGMDYNGERCLCTGGNIALGYKVNKKTKRFEVNPDTAPIVQLVFEMYAGGKTVTEITTHLNSLGYKTARGVPFNKNSLHTMLKNKRYIGIYTYKGQETPGGIPPIIPDELFEKVAEIMKKNKKAPARARAKVEYLLTTKLFCGHCKEMMTGFSGNGHMGTTYRYYICNRKKSKKCKKKMVSKEYIEELVLAECRKMLSPSNIVKIASEIARLCEEEKDTSNLKYLKKALSANERKHKNALNAVLEADEPEIRADLYKEISQLKEQHKGLEKQIAQEAAILPTLTEPEIRFFLTSLRDGSIKDIKYKKTLIAVLVNTIYLYDDKVTITFNSGDVPVTIDDVLLSKISENTRCPKGLFITGDGPP